MGVGIDVETVISSETIEDIRKQVADDGELALISKDVSGERSRLLFTLLFSAKESFFKAAYPTVGEYFGFDTVSLVNIDEGTSTLWLRTNRTLNERLPRNALIKSPYQRLACGKVATLVQLYDDSYHVRLGESLSQSALDSPR